MWRIRWVSVPAVGAEAGISTAKCEGGAGSGKSFVINTMTEWMERLFRQTGDNPNYPYILRLAYTGTAANIISGQTLHSTLRLPFGNKFQSLTSKEAAEKREQLSNLSFRQYEWT